MIFSHGAFYPQTIVCALFHLYYGAIYPVLSTTWKPNKSHSFSDVFCKIFYIPLTSWLQIDIICLVFIIPLTEILPTWCMCKTSSKTFPLKYEIQEKGNCFVATHGVLIWDTIYIYIYHIIMVCSISCFLWLIFFQVCNLCIVVTQIKIMLKIIKYVFLLYIIPSGDSCKRCILTYISGAEIMINTADITMIHCSLLPQR